MNVLKPVKNKDGTTTYGIKGATPRYLVDEAHQLDSVKSLLRWRLMNEMQDLFTYEEVRNKQDVLTDYVVRITL